MARIAFIGLGHMGGGMAPNLVKAGHEVLAFDLSEQALGARSGRGLRARPFDRARQSPIAEIVITMLPAAKHVLAVYRDEVFSHAPATRIADRLFDDRRRQRPNHSRSSCGHGP